MRMKEMIIKDKMFRYLKANSPNQHRKKCMENSKENMCVDIGVSKVKS